MSMAYGYLYGVLAAPLNVLPLWFPRIFAKFGALRQHAIYVRILTLLFCIAFTSVLIQAGSLFLIDYIPVSRSVASKIHQRQLFWTAELSRARAGSDAEAETVRSNLEKAYLDAYDSELVWLIRRDHPNLSAEIDNIRMAERKLKRAAEEGAPTAGWLPLADDVLASYSQLNVALQRDVEVKQSVIATLQLIGLLFLMLCIARIALETRRVLVERLNRLVDFIPEKFSYGSALLERDEFLRLEHKVSALTARLEGYVAEATWTNKISDHLRRVIGAQEFLSRFVELINEQPLNEAMLRRMLYALERALDVSNAAIIYTEEEPPTSSGRSVFSNHEPRSLSQTLFSELHLSGSSIFVGKNPDGADVRCIAVPFVEPSGEKGALLVEMEKERFLDDTDMQTLEITAGLLSVTSKFQSHDQEGRRIAVLEERAAIARELHDSLAQSLSFMKIQLARLQSSANTSADSSHAMIRELRAGLDNAYRELRELLATFRVHMDGRGLNHAIQSAIDEFSQRSSLSISLDDRLVNCRLTVNEEFHILQVVREALSNIVHHARANNAFIALMMPPNGSVVITIDDDGVGYSPNKEGHGHHGQAIMKERAYSLGGNIQVMTRRQGGTRVRLTFTPQSVQ